MSYKSYEPLLFVVEGHHEVDFLTKLTDNNQCRKNEIHRFKNGKRVSTKGLANQIDGIVKKKYNHCRFIILFDREKREESFEDLIEGVKTELKKIGHDMEKFIIGVADKYIESWILPFVDKEGNFPVIPTEGFDGSNCKDELKRRLGNRNIRYKNRTVGTRILLDIDPPMFKELAEFSDSFGQFFNEVKDYCKWLNRKKSS